MAAAPGKEWVVIDSNRIAVGTMWLPQLSLDLWGRDWAVLELPIDWGGISATTTISNITWTLFRTIGVCLPAWVNDAYYGDLRFYAQVSMTSNSSSVRCMVEQGGLDDGEAGCLMSSTSTKVVYGWTRDGQTITPTNGILPVSLYAKASFPSTSFTHSHAPGVLPSGDSSDFIYIGVKG